MNIGQIIKLIDEKEYMILDKMNLHNVNYMYLITINKPTEMLIVTESNNNGEIVLDEIKDNDELDYILSQFALNSNDEDEID